MTREDLNGTTMCVCVCVHACIKRLVLCLAEVYCVYGKCFKIYICLTENVKNESLTCLN